MRRSRLVVILVSLVLIVGTLWLWSNKPKPVDMATYAPANSLLFLESNHPLRVAESIVATDAWKSADQTLGLPNIPSQNSWFQGFVRWTGIGPIQSVILSRSQLAIVIADFGATEEGDVLNLRPEGAVVVETHTSGRRIRPVFEAAIERLAKANYDNPTSRRTTIDGVEFIEWRGSDASRQIVATIHGTLVIVGNSERAVQSCLAVALGRQPSLKDDPELRRMRSQLAGDDALAFGYVPSENSGRLLSVGLPLLLGRAPGDSEFQRVVARGATKIFGSLAWSSHPFGTAIKDRYVVSLQPSIVSQLKPHFVSGIGGQDPRIPADEVYSVSSYRFENPLAAWQALKTSVSSQVDALSAVIFSSILRSALVPYGIDEPEEFLQTIKGDVETIRFDPDGERVLLIARILNYDALRKLVTGKMALRLQTDRLTNAEVFVDTADERAATFIGDSVVMGSPAEVRRYAESQAITQIAMSDEKLKRVTYFTPASRATIVTYTNDEDRVRSFIFAIQSITGSRAEPQRMEDGISKLPYSATETTLTDRGLERTTLSPLGQFSTLLPLLIPNKQTGVTNASPAK